MEKTDHDNNRLGEHKDMYRLDKHAEAQRLQGHPQPESLPPHEESTQTTTPIIGKVPATSDAQETKGFARGAGWVALGILALMVVATFLWPPKATYRQDYAYSGQVANSNMNTYIAAIPNAKQVVFNDTVVELFSTVNDNASQPSAVVVYLFNTDSSTIPETASLTEIARKAHDTGKTVVVKAYTDESGRVAYNQRLSERRAKAVGDYMVAHGVPASRIKAKGYGPTHAYATNAQDRRAEVYLK